VSSSFILGFSAREASRAANTTQQQQQEEDTSSSSSSSSSSRRRPAAAAAAAEIVLSHLAVLSVGGTRCSICCQIQPAGCSLSH
jgi:hypothetical protein